VAGKPPGNAEEIAGGNIGQTIRATEDQACRRDIAAVAASHRSLAARHPREELMRTSEIKLGHAFENGKNESGKAGRS